jgi:hypothetical protein
LYQVAVNEIPNFTGVRAMPFRITPPFAFQSSTARRRA